MMKSRWFEPVVCMYTSAQQVVFQLQPGLNFRPLLQPSSLPSMLSPSPIPATHPPNISYIFPPLFLCSSSSFLSSIPQTPASQMTYFFFVCVPVSPRQHPVCYTARASGVAALTAFCHCYFLRRRVSPSSWHTHQKNFSFYRIEITSFPTSYPQYLVECVEYT